MRNRFVLVAVALLTGVLAVVARLWLQAAADGERAAAALQRGEPRVAQVFLEQASRAYFPGNRPASRAIEGLARLSERWEREGELRHALSAAESARGALVTTPAGNVKPRLREEADARVKRLRERLGTDAGERARTLERRREPALVPTAMALLALAAAGWLFWRFAIAWGAANEAGTGRGARLLLTASLLAAAGLALLALA